MEDKLRLVKSHMNFMVFVANKWKNASDNEKLVMAAEAEVSAANFLRELGSSLVVAGEPVVPEHVEEEIFAAEEEELPKSRRRRPKKDTVTEEEEE